MCFDYYSEKGLSNRTIEPYFITFKWSSWYVFGYCRDRNSFRLFKLNRLWRHGPEENWHTGDPDTDPWCWKDKVAEEKQIAFGCILGGYKGFVSARMYSVFYTAFHPKEHMEERRALHHI